MTNTEYQKNLRAKRKEQGLCTRCGAELEEGNKTTTCRKCKDYDKEYKSQSREYFKSVGLCPQCGKYKLFNDEKMCLECKANRANTSYKNSLKESTKEKHREYQKSVKEYRIENGLCTSCGDKNDTDGHTCSKCRKSERLRYRIRYGFRDGRNYKREKWKELGLCSTCGDEREAGYNVCKKCHERLIYVAHHPNTCKAREQRKSKTK